MARLLPANVTHLALAGGATPELATLDMLRQGLPDEYAVFHGVHWSREYKGSSLYGEIDFAIVNRAGAVLVIEQKNGPVEAGEGGLVKRYGGAPKNVGDQVRRALDNLRARMKGFTRDGLGPPVDYLVYCPDQRIRTLNAAAIDPARVVDAAGAAGLARRIVEILPPGRPDPLARTVEAFFCQSFDLVPDIHAHIASQERAFTRMGKGIVRLVDGIEMRNYRLRLCGTAGCGKSMIARHAYARAVAEGRRPLLLCFNRMLKEKFKAACGPGGLVETWYGLCKAFLDCCGDPVVFPKGNPPPGFWRDLQQRVIGHTVPRDWLFDTLIVDEGQDFEPEWREMLELFATPGARYLWLEDPDQNVRRGDPVQLEEFVTLSLRINYRSPARIADYIRRGLGVAFDGGNDLPGLGAGTALWERPEEQSALVARLVAERLREGFTAQDIMILTTRGVGKSTLHGKARVGNHTLRTFTGDYDLFGNQKYTDGQIRFDTIRRFKGGEAPAVILVDVDPGPDHDGEDKRLLFVGMTRATVRLDVVARRGNPVADRLGAA